MSLSPVIDTRKPWFVYLDITERTTFCTMKHHPMKLFLFCRCICIVPDKIVFFCIFILIIVAPVFVPFGIAHGLCQHEFLLVAKLARTNGCDIDTQFLEKLLNWML